MIYIIEKDIVFQFQKLFNLPTLQVLLDYNDFIIKIQPS